MGALQAAIEATDINNLFTRVADSDDLDHASSPPDGAMQNLAVLLDRKIAAGAPGYLTQGDLLSPLAPVLSSRSDTFVIRSYGDRKDPLSETVTSRAFLEAVVQRVPDFVDPSANDPSDAIEELDEEGLNRRFGRQYRIVSLTWLDQP